MGASDSKSKSMTIQHDRYQSNEYWTHLPMPFLRPGEFKNSKMMSNPSINQEILIFRSENIDDIYIYNTSNDT